MHILTKEQLTNFLDHGYSSIPQLRISDSKKKEIHKLAANQHQIYVESNEMLDILFPQNDQLNNLGQDLSIFASKACKKDVTHSVKNFYSILRCTSSQQKNETFLGHFDSHVCTIVIPVHIPIADEEQSGELVLFPNVRNLNDNWIKNFTKKILFQRFKNKSNALQILESKFKKRIFNFKDGNPIIFHGFNSFHWNFPFYGSENRITILIHYFDPDKYGVGRIMRILRNR